MCALVASFSIDKFKELFELNAYRGTMTSSFTVLAPDEHKDTEIVTLNRFNSVPTEKIINDPLFQEDHDCYFLGHSQAPTTSGSLIHPSESDDTLLWHNGIVKEHAIKELNEEYGTNYVWDTSLIQHIYETHGSQGLSEIDGTFACIMYLPGTLYAPNKLIMFRNILAPIFYDDDLNISSTKFKGSKSLPPHKVFEINLVKRQIEEWPNSTFQTKNNPYSI